MKKKQILFFLCIAVFAVGVIVFFGVKNKDDSYSSEYHKHNRDDTVVYEGKKYVYNDHLSNYLFMGIDSREPITEYETPKDASRADAIFLLSYDRVKKTLKCLSIPRDTIADVKMFAVDGTDMGTAKEHINMQYVFGDGRESSCQLMKDTVSRIFYGVPIQGYCALNMDGIGAAVEILEGVSLVIPDDSLQNANPEFISGTTVTLTKETAEQFVRYRDVSKSQSAIVRTNRQKVFLTAIAERAKEKSDKDSGFLVKMHSGIEPYMITNMGNDILAKLMQADYHAETDMIDLPGKGIEGEKYDEYHIDETRLYRLVLQTFYKEM